VFIPSDKHDRASCMMCGRGVDAMKAAAIGGRHRFCSDRCVNYFDATWDACRGPAWMVPKAQMGTGATCASYVSESARGTRRSEAAKLRERGKRKRALADSWKRFQAKRAAKVPT